MTQIKIIHYGLTDIGNVRGANEDSLGSVEGPYGPVFTVCDGMGGHVGGAAASALAVKTILEFISVSTIENTSVAINNALISANQKILETSAENPSLKGMGTTATIVVVQPDGIYIGHIGDSRIYIYTDRRLHRLTKDHSFVQSLVDSGAISEEEAESHPRKNELMKALGVSETVQPTIISSPIKPKKDDLILLCTDGLSGLVTDQEIQNLLAEYSDLSSAGENLINAAKTAGGYDNITLQLVRVVESPYTVSEFNSYSVSQKEKETKEARNVIHQDKYVPDRKLVNAKRPTAFPLRFVGIVAGLVIAALLTLAYATKNWPFNRSDSKNDSTNVRGTDGFFPGDRFAGTYLLHVMSPNDTSLEYLLKLRRDVNEPPYQDFNFDSTFSLDNKVVTPKNFKKFKEVRWRHRVLTFGPAPDDTIVVKADDSIREARERFLRDQTELNKNNRGKDTSQQRTQHPSDNTRAKETIEEKPDLQARYDKANQNLANAENKLTQAKNAHKAALDSIKVYSKNVAKKKEWDKKLEKANRDMNDAKAEKDKWQAEANTLQGKIQEIE